MPKRRNTPTSGAAEMSTADTDLTPPTEEVEAAAARAAWRESPQRRRALRFIVITSCLLALAVLASIPIARGVNEDEEATLVVFVVFVASAYLAGLAGWSYWRQQRRAWRDRRLIAKARVELERAEESLPEVAASVDFASLWTITQKRLDYYHQIATSQAEKSFLYGQLAAGIGFALILGCALAAAFAHSSAASIAAALLGVTGGGLAAYIGATFMRSQESASAQLRAYFLQPLEFSKILAAERLLEQITDPDSRTAATTSLVQALSRPPHGEAPPGP
jgi:hypothetical protein